MKQTKNQVVTLMVSMWISSSGLCAEPFAKGPYLGQTPPGPIPQVFAPGLICHNGPNKWESNATFSADGNTFCFQRGSDIYITENTDQGWTTPELIRSIPANIGSPWSACLSPDANSIYFIIGGIYQQHKHYGLFRCDRVNHRWSKPQRLEPPLSSPVSSPVRETSCSIAANNNIYLCSSRKGWDGKSGIWVVPFVDNTWPRATHLSIDHPLGNDPGIAPDESFMVFYSIRPGAIPGTETNLYLTLRRPDGSWTKPRNMGPRINTKYYEHGARISPDKKYLFFNRCTGWDPRTNTGDIYWVELKEYLPEAFRAPEGMANGERNPVKRRSVTKQIKEIDSVQAPAEPIAKGPYLGQTPPGPGAKVFAPGLICDTRPHQGEAWGTFSADGNTFCFNRLGYVYITENRDQGWTTPQRIESIPYKTAAACLSPDANSIFFTYSYDQSKYSLHCSLRTSQGWSLPQKLGPPLDLARGGFSLATDHSIYFWRWQGAKLGCFWVAPFVDNTWPQAIEIPVNVGTNLKGHHPGIAPDGSFMVFYSIRPGAIPGTETDLYLTLREADGTWTKPRNMGPKINTAYYHEFGARITPDKKYMFFTRSNGWSENPYRDTSDIYWVELKEYLPESYRAPEGIVHEHRDSMKRRSVIKQITGNDSIQAQAEPFAKGPYLGQIPPGSTAQVFAPGLICDTRPHQWESWASFSTDGNTFCFNRLGFVYITENSEQGWTAPKNIISVPYRTVSCCLSPDANSIYFIIAMKGPRIKHYGLNRCQRTPDGWSDPQELGPTFSDSGVYTGFSLTANNSIYFFHSKPKAGSSEGGIFYAPYENNTWPRLNKLPLVGTFPGIAQDESFMIFTAIRPEGLGETDLYLALRGADGTWGKARNLGPKINSWQFEFGARISPDKKYMFFTRSNGWFENPYHDTSDIYWVELKEYLPESYR